MEIFLSLLAWCGWGVVLAFVLHWVHSGAWQTQAEWFTDFWARNPDRRRDLWVLLRAIGSAGWDALDWCWRKIFGGKS